MAAESPLARAPAPIAGPQQDGPGPLVAPTCDTQAPYGPIFVTQPYLPPLEEFLPFLEDIWERKVLTNNGPCHQELERCLGQYLGLEHISLFANGTLALMTALQALDLAGEVITTPYSFVATSHALLWNRLQPVFVDIDPGTLNLHPGRIEAAITSRTTAILPMHCYGHPCDVAAIQAIADRLGLKVIYDAAHAFGVADAGGSILRHGDLSVLSFHATKVFNTFEGGAIVSPDADTKQRIDHLKNFGFVDETTVVEPGINGKMSEINAAFGLLQLKHIDAVLDERRRIDAFYRQRLAQVRGITCITGNARRHNASYFPILVESDYPLGRDALYALFKRKNIHTRRYFHPPISSFPMYSALPSAAPTHLPNTYRTADRVICLPIYPGLPASVAETIVATIVNAY
ncbi:DegT/DnrJ/EryC1/StrS family aminotransferase [Xanthomonas campestris pv. campestris]|nr:DegT/DnrJ/EryC1/StrS family aminotransferase [Xanthomonas campestris pv. campestris]